MSKLEPGDRAPAFTLTDDSGKKVALTKLKGKKVILYAYPAAMTPGCTTQACDFRDSLEPFKKAGYVILGISPDTPEKLAKFKEKDHLTFPLLSDPDKKVLEKYGAFGKKMNYGREYLGVIRSTFVINENGKIDLALYNVRAKGHVAKLRRELDV